MISVREALQIVLSELPTAAVERVGLQQAYGRALATDIEATRDVPPFRNSAMDGYALRAADIAGADQSPIDLEIIEVIAAGSVPSRRVEPRTAAMIMTGAVVPEGADAVVRIEDTSREPEGGERVRILKSVRSGANLRMPGEDMRRGEIVLRAGGQLNPADIGVLASLGITAIPVRRRPTVAILTTGDELVEPDQPVGPGQIVNSNAYTLAAAVQQAGGLPTVMDIVRDDRDGTRAAFTRAFDHDVVLSTGGVSMGVFDLVRSILAELGVRERFWKVAQKPGKPISFGVRNGAPIFGLPGNPVSSLVCFYLYVVPALRAMQGLRAIHFATVGATAGEDMRTTEGMTELIRCTLEGPLDALRVRPTGTQSSGVLRSMSLGDGLLISPPEEARITAGQRVSVLLLGDRYQANSPFGGSR